MNSTNSMRTTSTTPRYPEGCVGLFRGGNERLQGQNQGHRLFSPPVNIPGLDRRTHVPTPNEMDRIIAREMTHLSMQERELAENDVHGIGNTTDDEDPLQLQGYLLHLQRHLEAVKDGTAYAEAERMDPSYVNDRDFRLMFLRADRYDPKETADRMIRFFDLKKSLFGSQKLCKDITMADLDPDDMETLRSGYLQLPPYKDMAGRTLLIGMLKLRKMKDTINASRVTFYMFMVAMESAEAQRRGMVCVYYLLDASNFSSVTGKLRSTMPANIVSLHLCYNDITQYAVTCMGVYALSQRTKVRFRPHYGSHIECQYALSTFGIPRQALPVSTSGEMYTTDHMLWIETRQAFEAEQEYLYRLAATNDDNGLDTIGSMPSAPSPQRDSSSSTLPRITWTSDASESVGTRDSKTDMTHIRPNDVLFGRGKTVVEHPGNLEFRNIVGMQMEEYESASRLKKTCMTEKIVQMVHASDGRFLKRDDGGDWEEVDQETARRKVAHAFRNRRKFNGMF